MLFRSLYPSHLTSLACLIEQHKLAGAKIRFKYDRQTKTGQYLVKTKFINYWNKGFNRNHCFTSELHNTLPIWQLEYERINSYAERTKSFYEAHSIVDKDLTPVILTIQEALNNVSDHSESKAGGFIFTQYYPKKSELEVSICDFGIGIPNKVNKYLAKNDQKKLV